jgi:FkbM family methyltransferase
MRWLDARGRLSGTWDLTLNDGTRLHLPRKSPMAWTAAFRGSYDAEARELVIEHIAPGTLILDIGASIGLWTVPLGRRARTLGAHVWAFEPHPNNHAWLHGNVRLNGLESVVDVHEIALGDAPGTVTMDKGEAGRPGGGGNSAIAVDHTTHGVRVPITTLDIISRPTRVSVIKIDVEGYEIRVLRGAARLIEADRPVIFGEFHPAWFRERGEDVYAFLEDMRDLDYEILRIEGLRTRPWRAVDTARLRLVLRGRSSADLLLWPRSAAV